MRARVRSTSVVDRFHRTLSKKLVVPPSFEKRQGVTVNFESEEEMLD